MFNDKAILILEGDSFLALDLAQAIEQLGGSVVGPAVTIDEALRLLDAHRVAGAIVNAEMDGGDVAPLTLRLSDLGVPFVLHAEVHPPATLQALHPSVPVFRRPLHPEAMIEGLAQQIRHPPNVMTIPHSKRD